MRSYHQIAYTPAVQSAQDAHGTRQTAERMAQADVKDDRVSPKVAEFIQARDTFYMASVTEDGWPYVQHRGGPTGFLKVLDDKTLGFADYEGNRQYITQGNVSVDDRVSLFLVDYPRRRRLKIFARAAFQRAEDNPELARRVVDSAYGAKIDRIVLLTVEALDWNCPQHITPRFTAEELEPLRLRLEELEAENAALRMEHAHTAEVCD